jgi:hypothetical protein
VHPLGHLDAFVRQPLGGRPVGESALDLRDERQEGDALDLVADAVRLGKQLVTRCQTLRRRRALVAPQSLAHAAE